MTGSLISTATVVSYLWGTHQVPLHPLLPSFQSILFKHQFVLGTEAGIEVHVVPALVALSF